ncbi:MAG: SRPBCC family protein [Dysgonamonadaceae bacterium]
MTEFVSEIKTIPHTLENVYRVLSDLSKLEMVKDKIPTDKIKDFTFDTDSCSFKIDPIGYVKFVVVEREPNKLVKFKSEDLPFEVFLWLQLVSKDENDTKMRLTVKADVNAVIKSMVSKPMRDAIDKVSDALSLLPYDII